MKPQCSRCQAPLKPNALTPDDAFCPACGQPVNGVESPSASGDSGVSSNASAGATDAQKKIKVFHCPDCNMPLVPSSTSCLKCGKQFAKPIPKIVAPSQPQTTYQDPILEGTEYHCPKCQTVLETGTKQCPNCGIQFMYPIPVYKMSAAGQSPSPVMGAPRRRKNPAKTVLLVVGGCFAVLFLIPILMSVIGSVLHPLGSYAPVSTTPSPAPTSTSTYVPSPSAVSQPNQPTTNMALPPLAPTQNIPPSSQEDINNQFDVQNEISLENIANTTGTNLNTVKIIAHAILRGYLNNSPVQDAAKRQTDFEFTMRGVNVLARFEEEKPGAGCFQVALEAASGTDTNQVIKDLNGVRMLFVNSDVNQIENSDGHVQQEDTSELGNIVMGILRAR